MGGDPQKSGELAEPWDYGVTMGLHANHYYKTHLRSPLSALAIHDILVQYLNIIVRSEISKVFRSYPQFQNFNKIVVLSNFIVHTFSYLQIGKNKISSIIIWDLCLWCEKRIKLVLLCHYKFDYLISGVMMASRRTWSSCLTWPPATGLTRYSGQPHDCVILITRVGRPVLKIKTNNCHLWEDQMFFMYFLLSRMSDVLA